jgi:valyl-tRNA synthetase
MLDKGFDPKAVESRWYAHWEAIGLFRPRGEGRPYCILLPPPNVTGTLHMGHAFQHTLMDTLVRYRRMCGDDVLWQMGTDHAGIATEMVVSRLLEQEGKSREQLGREAFLERVWAWKQESGGTIERQMRRLGASGDWSRSVFTMDPMPSRAVIECFVRLYEEGLIYRGKKLVNWDPVLKTAISDLEVVSEEEEGRLWLIRYPLADGEGAVTVATTRPETMLGDTAVMVHPEDERYRHLIGRRVRLPLAEREIPIIADTAVDPAFGTGCVKVTPAHDFNDYEVGQRHGLPLINVFDAEACINDAAPARFRGLERFAARKAVLQELAAAGLLVEERPHRLMVPRGDRSGQIIEPWLTDQWFVRMKDMAERALALAESGAVRFVPDNWIATYRHWLRNIQDWCISRQLWWGHRIPAWYGPEGAVYVGRDEAEVRARHALPPGLPLRQDPDVLETWFSSAIWPFSTMGWPDPEKMRERGFDRYLPSAVLVTGFDILFFWVARMVMMTDHFTGRVPFREVYVTGLVRDKDGQKMSKSKGNILDPLDLIDGIDLPGLLAKRTSGLMQPRLAERIAEATRKEFPEGIPAFGADALRLTFASLASHGRDIKFDLGRCEGYRNFCNKLWNATRFVLLQLGGERLPKGEPEALSPYERWILGRLDRLSSEVHGHLAAYRFDLLAQSLHAFVWDEYCDWFLELAKPVLQEGAERERASMRHTLAFALERALRLLHPLIPFVTEELWQQLAPALGLEAESLGLMPYPEPSGRSDANAEAEIGTLKALVVAIRRLRSEYGVPPARGVEVLALSRDARLHALVAAHRRALSTLARLSQWRWIGEGEAPRLAAAAVEGDCHLFLPLEGLIDLEAERERLGREIARLEREIERCESKLARADFRARAPAAVVAQEEARLADFRRRLAALIERRARLEGDAP